jgi:repressor LexA
MIDEGIFDNDIIIVKKQSVADNGDTVVAIIDDNTATLKKIYIEDNKKIKLQPANSKYKPIYRKEVEIRGVVVKIIRNLK